MSHEVWMWVHQKYGMIQIVWKNIYSKQTTALTLMLPMVFSYIKTNNDTYDLQWTSSKIMMTITIIIDHMSLHCSINM